jgi:glycosyltransferase involved in cell wall biosynthesis
MIRPGTTGDAMKPTVVHLALASARGGAEVVVESLATAAQRYTSVIAAPEGADHLSRWRAAGLTVVDVPPAPRMRSVLAARAYVRELAAVITTVNAAIVHTHGVGSQRFGGRAAHRAGRPIVWHLHDCLASGWSADGAVHRLALAAPHDAVIAVSHAVADSWRARLSDSALTVIHNGVLSEDVPAARRPPGSFVVWCGRLQRWKGPGAFLDVAARVRQRVPDARFAVVGGTVFGLEPDLPAALRAQAAALGIADVVDWIGQVDDARPWLAAADVVVHCAAAPEPFGLTMVEAMVQQRPVVAFDRGGAAEIVAHDTTGLLVPAGDLDAMAAAVEGLLADPDRRRHMGAAGAARAREHFSVAGMVRHVESAYDRLLTHA